MKLENSPSLQHMGAHRIWKVQKLAKIYFTDKSIIHVMLEKRIAEMHMLIRG